MATEDQARVTGPALDLPSRLVDVRSRSCRQVEVIGAAGGLDVEAFEVEFADLAQSLGARRVFQ